MFRSLSIVTISSFLSSFLSTITITSFFSTVTISSFLSVVYSPLPTSPLYVTL